MPRRTGWVFSSCQLRRLFRARSNRIIRQSGRTYKELEDAGVFLVLAKIEVRYRLPARYDDLLTLRTIVTRTTPVRIEHRYEVLRGTQLLAEGGSTLACVDRDGKLQGLPEWLYQ